ncbi:hypothetical protein C0993_001331 [Termitomyces sp. T159_Od127]|nr:hypothetical protein C0993_001331 [Termitomyces sp. T159_Od127]
MSSSSSTSSSRSSSPEPLVPDQRKRKTISTEIADDVDAVSDAEPTPDEPVLSHADRRKQRKVEKRKAKEADEGVSTNNSKKKRKLENGKSLSVPVPAAQRKNSVWVGNLSFKTTQENLKAFFKDVGEVVRIHMPTKPGANKAMKPENRGFAYVDFATKDAKIVAIALSEQPLLGRKLLIKDGELFTRQRQGNISQYIFSGDDFAGRPAKKGVDAAGPNTHSKTARKILGTQKQPPASTLFLGNLGFETTEEDIKQLLEAHRTKPPKKKSEAGEGEDEDAEEKEKTKDVWLRKVRMGTFEDSGLCKGFAFVDFTSTEHATAVLINPKNHRLNGRDLVVEYASAEAVRRGAPKGSKREDGAAPSPSKKQRDVPPHSKRAERPERKPRHNRDEAQAQEPVEQEEEKEVHNVRDKAQDLREERKTFAGKDRKEKGPRSRPKPGAALAQAKRESAAILPSTGSKITF